MSEKIITLPVYEITITLIDGDPENHRRWLGGNISSSLHKPCPACGDVSCYSHCENSEETEDEWFMRATFNKMMRVIESYVLAQAQAGVDIESPACLEALETAVDAIGNNT